MGGTSVRGVATSSFIKVKRNRIENIRVHQSSKDKTCFVKPFFQLYLNFMYVYEYRCELAMRNNIFPWGSPSELLQNHWSGTVFVKSCSRVVGHTGFHTERSSPHLAVGPRDPGRLSVRGVTSLCSRALRPPESLLLPAPSFPSCPDLLLCLQLEPLSPAPTFPALSQPSGQDLRKHLLPGPHALRSESACHVYPDGGML